MPRWLQIDTPLESSEFPVLLGEETKANRTKRMSGLPMEPMLYLALDDVYQWGGILCVEEVRASLQPLAFCLEQDLVARLVHMKRSLAEQVRSPDISPHISE